jgi:hypothetical protein
VEIELLLLLLLFEWIAALAERLGLKNRPLTINEEFAELSSVVLAAKV